MPVSAADAPSIARVGLDIGGSSVKGVGLDAGGSVVARAKSGGYERPDEPTLRRALAEVLDGLGHADSASVGLCVPGILSEDRTRVEVAVNLPGLVGLDCAAALGEALGDGAGAGRSVRLVSDAFASAYGYWAEERAPGRLLALVIGTGVGAAVLDGGEPVEVEGNCPGHLGQVDVGPCGGAGEPAPVGPDGGENSLEAYIGAAALTERLGKDRVAGLLAAGPGDPAWIALARAIRIGHAIYRPDRVALLGGVGSRLGPGLAVLRELVDRRLTSVARAGWELRSSGTDASGAVGAALLSG